MSGIVTDSRVLAPSDFSYSMRWGLGETYYPSVGYIPPENQTTTSFRSRGGDDLDEISTLDPLLTYRNGFTTYDPQFDRGHEFFTTRTSISTSHPRVTGTREPRAGMYTGYRGPIYTNPTLTGLQGSFPAIRRLSSDDIRSFGARAISATIPTSPQASITTVLGEVLLDGGLPYLGTASVTPGVGNNAVKGLASDHLNAQFGWIPLVSDVKKLISSLKSATRTIRQLERDSGSNVRRSFVFPTITSDTEEVLPITYGGNPWNNVHGDLVTADVGATLTVRSSRKRDIWFKGSFTYYINSGNGLMDKLERYEQLGNKLLGSRLNAAALWELAPWSWLVDWQSTVGVALSNASSLSEDGLVIRYGYLMSRTEDIITCTAHGFRFHSGSVGHTSTQYRRVSKERYRATPYGFGLDLRALSPKQWSILGALGMTRGSGSLKLTS